MSITHDLHDLQPSLPVVADAAPSDRPAIVKPRRQSPAPGPSPDLIQHARRCLVCKHPEREAIEESFLQWRSALWITREFGLPNRSSVYRHAHAFNMFPRRREGLRFALEHIIEGAECVAPNATAVVDAVRAYTHRDDSGRWIESPTTHFIIGGNQSARPLPAPPVRNTRKNRK